MSNSSILEKTLDEIIGEKHQDRRRNKGSSHNRRGVSKNPRGFNSRSPRPRPRSRSRPRSRPRVSASPIEEIRPSELESLSERTPYLKVKNLHYDLTQKDLTELFERIAPVKFTRIQYNTSGGSTGVAYVCFTDPSFNNLAIEKYDGKKAAGQIISVQNGVPLKDRLSSPVPRQPASFRSRGRPRGPRGRFNENKRRPAENRKTLEDLDDELSNYMNGERNQTEPNPDALNGNDNLNQVTKDTSGLDAELDSYMNETSTNTRFPAV
ncbi:uncharacterized protein ASCRUDRAFT_73289 [Ascoidea rubescens DSM 1968]|uniref:RRM domain-containing protein n=1 Tax=Ascoidea rubescens DSM 1968 TaxID=1344418 RepID=A0A1D2VPB0_9ASCO|nr:hypothetical protein ASCRUDRAFT_73289 [Ascoidea rubescens DSM 1968]ODV63424.1 hypothetical protein ASCRUDRAFT_73289 [Ascoidea rubescens DSM 1968]